MIFESASAARKISDSRFWPSRNGSRKPQQPTRTDVRLDRGDGSMRLGLFPGREHRAANGGLLSELWTQARESSFEGANDGTSPVLSLDGRVQREHEFAQLVLAGSSLARNRFSIF